MPYHGRFDTAHDYAQAGSEIATDAESKSNDGTVLSHTLYELSVSWLVGNELCSIAERYDAVEVVRNESEWTVVLAFGVRSFVELSNVLRARVQGTVAGQ